MLSNIPFNVKDWAMWIIMWLAVGFFIAIQMGNAYALGRGHGPLCYMAHSQAYCDADMTPEQLMEEERINRSLGAIGNSLQGAGNALQQGGGYYPTPQQQLRVSCHYNAAGTAICNYW